MSITTPLTFPLAPGDDYDKAQTFATIASAFAYGMAIVLFLNCFHLLLKSKHIYSNKMRLSLSVYMLVMFGLSTLAIVQAILYNRRAIFCNSEGFLGTPFGLANTISDLTFSLNIPMLIPLTIWGADGFMVQVASICRLNKPNSRLANHISYGVACRYMVDCREDRESSFSQSCQSWVLSQLVGHKTKPTNWADPSIFTLRIWSRVLSYKTNYCSNLASVLERRPPIPYNSSARTNLSHHICDPIRQSDSRSTDCRAPPTPPEIHPRSNGCTLRLTIQQGHRYVR